MKKFLSFFAAMLMAVAVNAETDFAAPGFACTADNAALTGGSTDNFYFQTDTLPHLIVWSDVSLASNAVASWGVTATRGCYVTVSLALGPIISSNKHNFEVTIKDANGNIKGTLTEGGENTASEQVKVLDGTILIPAAGYYTVELFNNRNWGKGAIKNVTLTYAADAPEEMVAVTGIELNKTTLTLEEDEAEQLVATVSPEDAFDPSVTWISSDPSVITVDGGFVTANEEGTATLTASAGDFTATCAVTVVAPTVPTVNFAEPYVLSGKMAHLDGKIWKMYKDDTYKLYGDGDHNKNYGTAEWYIHVAKPYAITGTLNGVEGGHEFALDVYKDGQLVSSLTQPEGKTWSAGNIALDGKVTLPAAGDYVLTLRNTQEWSSGKVAGVTLAGEELRKFYLKLSDDWAGYPAKYAIYYFKHGVGDGWSDWMTAVENETNLYTAMIPADNDTLIFVRLNGGATAINWDNKWSQTVDLVFPEDDNDMFTVTAGGTGNDCTGEWSKYVAPAVPDIAWELNGGAMPFKGSTNEELWATFKLDYNAFYASQLTTPRADQPIDEVASFIVDDPGSRAMMLSETAGWRWLAEYAAVVCTAQGWNLLSDETESHWRWVIDSFFNKRDRTSWPMGSTHAVFTEAGKEENWLPVYRASMMPESVDAEFTLVAPTKKGYTFAGWFDNAEFSGDALTTIPANFQGKLYAKWTALPAQQFYLKPGPWYYAANGEKFAMYAFEEGLPEYWSAFMSLAENETSIYTGTIPGGYTHVIFVRFGSASTNPSWSDNMWNQSEDLTIEADKDMYTITAQGPWVENEGSPKAEGAWSKYEYVAPAKFYILGTNGWELTDLIRSDEDSYVLHLEAGYYEIKVLVDGTWATSKGYDDLTEVAAGLSKNEEFGNICFTLDADGDVTVTYTGEVFKLEGSFHVSGTAIDNAAVEAKVVKMIENGQIVIIRNGEKFNIQGQVIR